MIKRSTWVMLVIFALVIASYFAFRGRISTALALPTPTSLSSSFLITPSDGNLQSLRIYDKNYHTVEIQLDTSGAWVVVQPVAAPADQSLAGAAESQVGALKILTTLVAPPSPKDIGLDFPAFIMKLAFAGGKQYILEVGSLTPTGSGYYVRLDAAGVYVISKAGIDALVNLVTAPPYPATETPLPSPEPATTLVPATSTP